MDHLRFKVYHSYPPPSSLCSFFICWLWPVVLLVRPFPFSLSCVCHRGQPTLRISMMEFFVHVWAQLEWRELNHFIWLIWQFSFYASLRKSLQIRKQTALTFLWDFCENNRVVLRTHRFVTAFYSPKYLSVIRLMIEPENLESLSFLRYSQNRGAVSLCYFVYGVCSDNHWNGPGHNWCHTFGIQTFLEEMDWTSCYSTWFCYEAKKNCLTFFFVVFSSVLYMPRALLLFLFFRFWSRPIMSL